MPMPKAYDWDKIFLEFNGERLKTEPMYSGSWSHHGSVSFDDILASVRYAHWRGQWVTAWDLIGMEVLEASHRPAEELCWAVLGLQPGAGERDIKRAYARLVRQHPPEGDAAAFQRVRLAYEEALTARPESPEPWLPGTVSYFMDDKLDPVVDLGPHTCRGEWLDHMARVYGVPLRRPGETDEELRARILGSWR